jgi:hypothetical protein
VLAFRARVTVIWNDAAEAKMGHRKSLDEKVITVLQDEITKMFNESKICIANDTNEAIYLEGTDTQYLVFDGLMWLVQKKTAYRSNHKMSRPSVDVLTHGVVAVECAFVTALICAINSNMVMFCI